MNVHAYANKGDTCSCKKDGRVGIGPPPFGAMRYRWAAFDYRQNLEHTDLITQKARVCAGEVLVVYLSGYTFKHSLIVMTSY